MKNCCQGRNLPGISGTDQKDWGKRQGLWDNSSKKGCEEVECRGIRIEIDSSCAPVWLWALSFYLEPGHGHSELLKGPTDYLVQALELWMRRPRARVLPQFSAKSEKKHGWDSEFPTLSSLVGRDLHSTTGWWWIASRFDLFCLLQFL